MTTTLATILGAGDRFAEEIELQKRMVANSRLALDRLKQKMETSEP